MKQTFPEDAPSTEKTDDLGSQLTYAGMFKLTRKQKQELDEHIKKSANPSDAYDNYDPSDYYNNLDDPSPLSWEIIPESNSPVELRDEDEIETDQLGRPSEAEMNTAEIDRITDTAERIYSGDIVITADVVRELEERVVALVDNKYLPPARVESALLHVEAVASLIDDEFAKKVDNALYTLYNEKPGLDTNHSLDHECASMVARIAKNPENYFHSEETTSEPITPGRIVELAVSAAYARRHTARELQAQWDAEDALEQSTKTA